MLIKAGWAGMSAALALVAPSSAAGWPRGEPTNYFELTAKGEPTLICAEWRHASHASEMSCHILNVPAAPWPPTGVKPWRTWKTVRGGVKVTCSQWNATRKGRYVGLLARCDPVR